LFEEVQSRTRELARSVAELKALGKVGQAVSSTLDINTVLSTILEHACEMSETGGGAIYVFDEARSEFVLEAGRNMSDELIAAVRAHPIRLGEPLVGQCGVRREAVQMEDITKAASHPLIDVSVKMGVRALLAVPLLHQDEVIGALVVRRNRPGAFSSESIRLLEAFAAQSAIAVHNARLFHEIEEKGRQLEIASQHKSQFVANMSHELRTPLAAMLGYAELLRDGTFGMLPEKSIRVIDRVQANGKHLLGLINSVLDISKIEAGQFRLNLSDYSVSTLIETVRIATESLAGAKGLALTTEVATELPHGFGDEQRLSQVLLNLVGNAIKFTDTGEVRITAAAVNDHYALSVSDTGPGIPPEERDRIFEKFHQIDSSITKAKGGTGLGLAIAKQIVEMHGGRIWVESTLGRGSIFRMELPMRATAATGTAS
jgi:signal transduction histidine kinase